MVSNQLAREKLKILYICNLLPDGIVKQRSLRPPTNSCVARLLPTLRACRKVGVKVWVLSLGRNRQQSSYRWFPAKISRVEGIPVVFAAFWDCPVFTHLVTMFSLALILWRLRRRTVSAVFCNAMPHYVLALLVLRIATINCVLNLEDGIRADMKDFRSRVGKVLVGVWDRLSVAAMVANSRLVEQIKTRPAYCFYGVAREMEIVRSWDLPLQVLFSGNLSEGTGARNLLDGLLILTREYPDVASRFHFVVTGSGDLAREVETLAGGLLSQHIEFRGVVSDGEYQDLLRTSHIGLCLKMPDYSMGQTTFPSKTVEFAIWGLLVVTHRVSDVPLLFPDDGAFLLDEATPEALTQVLRQIASAPRDAQIRADRGRQAIGIRLRPQVVATDLARLWQSPPHPLRRKRGEDVSRA